MQTADETLAALQKLFRRPGVAEIGGFRPPDDPSHSWFGRAVHHPKDEPILYQGKPLFPLIQIRCSDLPEVPDRLVGVALLVVYMNCKTIPFGLPHGEGWAIREYSSLEGLVPCPHQGPGHLRAFPIKWHLGTPEGPGWESAWEIIDMTPVNASKEHRDRFFEFEHYSQTKVGGYPSEIQHGFERLEDFVFQIGSEPKPCWGWGDDGIATFSKSSDGNWHFECQMY
ncbi:MAG: DUF1963 domain-containing protein [Burkholderiales bacterium]|nr:DUF1963 domain-containing protein [Burkholderiales bacterium]